ncbi:unnamed protein product [Caenorhabditis nigoni]
MTTIESKSSTTASCSSESYATKSPIPLGPTGKRLDYITWHQHHMYMTRMLSEMSTSQEPNGCYIVDEDHYQIISGYSGEVTSKDDSCQCAILSALRKLEKKSISGENFIMYITTFPNCTYCLERILHMKISKIWYWNPIDSTVDDQSIKNLETNGIQCEKYQPTRTISIDFHE